MQVVHTAALPPNQGRIMRAMSGWTRNKRKALSRIVTANSQLAWLGLWSSSTGGASLTASTGLRNGDSRSFVGRIRELLDAMVDQLADALQHLDACLAEMFVGTRGCQRTFP